MSKLIPIGAPMLHRALREYVRDYQAENSAQNGRLAPDGDASPGQAARSRPLFDGLFSGLLLGKAAGPKIPT